MMNDFRQTDGLISDLLLLQWLSVILHGQHRNKLHGRRSLLHTEGPTQWPGYLASSITGSIPTAATDIKNNKNLSLSMTSCHLKTRVERADALHTKAAPNIKAVLRGRFINWWTRWNTNSIPSQLCSVYIFAFQKELLTSHHVCHCWTVIQGHFCNNVFQQYGHGYIVAWQ